MVTLEITTGGVFLGIAAVGIAAYAFYRVGKKSQVKEPESSRETTIDPNKYIKSNPNTPKAKQAFIENIEKLMPFVKGVTEIAIDKAGLTDAIISINDEDLTALWKQMINRPELWVNQMAAWGVAPDACKGFTAMEKHKALYSSKDGKELQLGQKYKVLSACWLHTTTENNGNTVKKVVKKGIVESAG